MSQQRLRQLPAVSRQPLDDLKLLERIEFLYQTQKVKCPWCHKEFSVLSKETPEEHTCRPIRHRRLQARNVGVGNTTRKFWVVAGTEHFVRKMVTELHAEDKHVALMIFV